MKTSYNVETEDVFYIKIFLDYSCTLYKNGVNFDDGLNFKFCFTQISLN